MDPFGNIVAEGAEPLSICHFEVEHLFPRRRGGRTVLQVSAREREGCLYRIDYDDVDTINCDVQLNHFVSNQSISRKYHPPFPPCFRTSPPSSGSLPASGGVACSHLSSSERTDPTRSRAD